MPAPKLNPSGKIKSIDYNKLSLSRGKPSPGQAQALWTFLIALVIAIAALTRLAQDTDTLHAQNVPGIQLHYD